ncbi:hypothetical protein ASZ78_000030, partial [Callipepla squamata]
ERGGWAGLSSLQKVALLLGLPAGATVLYIVYRRYREGRVLHAPAVGAEEMGAEVHIPRAAVRAVIGRKGATIRRLRQETGARIDLEEEDGGEEQLLLISGSPSQVCRAKAAVHQIVVESTPVSEQLHVPQRAVGRIIGRGGETVRSICRISGAQVQCQQNRETMPAPVRLIQISGTRREVDAAKKLIMEKLTEDVVFRQELAQTMIIGERSLQLDKLISEMTQHYEGNSQMVELAAVQAGDIVAAPYTGSSNWYRARVLGTLENGNLDLYYVDFGDNGEAPREALRALRSDFLSLPFQAIECSLAGIMPVGEQWDEAALDAFDRLTCCAQWKPLMAKISSYTQAGLCTWPRITLYDVRHGEVNPVPHRSPPVTAREFDVLHPPLISLQSLDIGAELLRLGHAAVQPHEEEEGDGYPLPTMEGAVEISVSGAAVG